MITFKQINLFILTIINIILTTIAMLTDKYNIALASNCSLLTYIVVIRLLEYDDKKNKGK